MGRCCHAHKQQPVLEMNTETAEIMLNRAA